MKLNQWKSLMVVGTVGGDYFVNMEDFLTLKEAPLIHYLNFYMTYLKVL